jgi:hypothetical protein
MRKLDEPKGKRVNKNRTICEVHRQIYDLMVTRYNDDEICDLLDEAFVMGIKMNNRLVEYKCIFENECALNPDKEKIEALRNLRIELTG